MISNENISTKMVILIFNRENGSKKKKIKLLKRRWGCDLGGMETHLKSQSFPTPLEEGEGIHHQGDHQWQSSRAASASDIQLRQQRSRQRGGEKASNY